MYHIVSSLFGLFISTINLTAVVYDHRYKSASKWQKIQLSVLSICKGAWYGVVFPFMIPIMYIDKRDDVHIHPGSCYHPTFKYEKGFIESIKSNGKRDE